MKKVDKTGLKFGKLTVLSWDSSKSGHSMWRCLCECGIEKVVMGCSLTSGATTSCGCFKIEVATERGKQRVTDLTNQRFGRILVVGRNFDKQKEMKVNAAYWDCLCDCGNKTIIRGSNLIRKNKPTKSCGCFAKESTSSRNTFLYSLPNGESGFNAIFYHYQRNAATRGYKFELTKAQFKELCQQTCFYCGAEPSNCQKRRCNTGDFVYNGVDRVDNELGYFVSNCVACCGICNRMKLTMTQIEFKNWIQKSYEYWASK